MHRVGAETQSEGAGSGVGLVGRRAVFAVCFALPIEWPRFNKAVFESLALVKSYAQEHVLLCLVPALSPASMLVIRSVLGTGKTVVFVCLVVVLSTITGLIFGAVS